MGIENGWGEWSKYVLKTLEDIDKRQSEMISHLNKLDLDLQVFKKEMQIKSGVWGLLGGLLPIAVGLLLYIFKQYVIP